MSINSCITPSKNQVAKSTVSVSFQSSYLAKFKDDKQQIKLCSSSVNNVISEHIFVGDNYDGYKAGEFKRNKLGFQTFKKINIGKNIKIATNNYVKFNINNEKKIIELEQIDWRGRAIIFDSILYFFIIKSIII